jgi:hypothetical protein
MAPATVKAALEALLLRRDISVEDVIDRYFTPDYRQRTDGTRSDRAEFAAHIAHLREVVADLVVHVHEELSSGPTYAERHTVELTKTDGSPVLTEVYLFGERAPDGRFKRIEEVTMLLSGTEKDRYLGSAR